MEAHLDSHYTDHAPARPVYGEITAIFPPDDASGQNWSGGTITLYQVTTNQQWPSVSEALPPCPALNQHFGLEDGVSDFEDTYSVGEQVVVGFLEMDPQRPIILGRAPTWETVSAPTESTEQPITRLRRRNTEVVIDKEGNASVQLADGKAFTVKDSSGSVVIKLLKSGGGDYVVYLGGDSSLQRLIDERAAAIFNGHVHHYLGDSGIPQVSGPPADDATTPGIVTTTPTAITSDHMTTLTKAK